MKFQQKVTKDEETKAVSNIIYNMEQATRARKNGFILIFGGHIPEPEKVVTLAKFIQAVRTNTHRDWQVFRHEVSNIRTETMRGRSVPLKPSKPKGSDQLLKLLRPKPVFMGNVNFDKCRNKADTIKTILKMDCPLQVKKEYLSGIKL